MKLYRSEYYILSLLGIITIIGLLSNYHSYQNGNQTSGAAIFGDLVTFNKAFVSYIGVRLLSKYFNSNKVLNSITKYIELIFYILSFIIVLDFIFKFFPQPPRYGVYSFQLFFKHPSRFGFAFTFIFLALLPKYYKDRKSILVFVLLLGMLSLRVKYIGFGFLTVVFMFYGKRLFKIPKAYFLWIVVSLALIMLWLFWDTFQMYFTFKSINTAWSRAIVLYYSFIIGNDFFPLGSGFGTYSSYYSGVYYSWVYDSYKISKVYGISRIYPNFIADQYWPMVLGQFGYFGLLCMVGIIYQYFKLFLTNIKFYVKSEKYYYFLSIILGLLLLLVDSTSDAIFSQQRGVVMFIYFALVVNTVDERHEK
ncbi:hypothetical protein [uncultured Winogradskyella sp.]|uniref:hypothetical protein n=1 Tax=uncultured Winogradskyella sp. TaxID=395353 RepID=UPI0030EDD888